VIIIRISAYDLEKKKGVKAMDNQKDYSCIENNGVVMTKKLDVENDFQQTLPAYADDIYRIVKCSAKNYITSVVVGNGEVKIYAKCAVGVTYYNDSAGLCYADFEEEYQKTVNIEGLSDSAFACADICDNYTNYRVINQRRIDIHSSASVNLTVYDKVKYPCLNACENSRLRAEEICCADLLACNHSHIEFDEDFSVSADSAPIKRIISNSAYASLNEIKIIKDKALIKACVHLTVLYTTDEAQEQLNKADYSIPVSKIIDVSGVNDTDKSVSRLKLGNIYLKPKASGSENMNMINVFGELFVSVLFIRENTLSVVTDGYLMNSGCNCEYNDFRFLSCGKYINNTEQVKLNFSLSGDITEVKDTNLALCEGSVKNSVLSVKANLSALCVNVSGDLGEVSASADFSLDLGLGDGAFCSLTINSYDYTLTSNGSLEVRLTLNVNAFTYFDKCIKTLSDINSDGEGVSEPCLTIYFGKEKEDIWNIAKELHSDTELIKSENQLSSDTLGEDKVLIIPRVQEVNR
jgi:hypothetical protein